MTKSFLIKNFQYYFLILVCSFTSICAQEALLEKIYVHTDRTFYFPGETLWFKAYVTTPQHTIADFSETLHAELISPKGDVVANSQIEIANGYGKGEFDLQSHWAGGIYKLRMYTNWMKNYGETAVFEKKITIQKVVQPNLLLKLDFERKAYGANDTVIANFEVKDLKNKPFKTPFNYVVTIKGEQFKYEEAETTIMGKGTIKFQLPVTLKTQDVLLNVLIPFKGSTESISRSVPVILNKIDLQFLPESGNLLANTTNKIAFKAVNEFGKPADVSGVIIDANGVKITSFSSFHDGMGSLSFKPLLGKTYKALITKPFTADIPINLPKAKQETTIISLDTITNGHYKFIIKSSENKKMTLKCTDVGRNLLSKEIVLKLKDSFYQKETLIDTKAFPSGIIAFTLFDDKNLPLAERLVFVNKHKTLNVKVSLEKEIYNIRELVKVRVKTTDNKNNPIPANLSISVADNNLITLADDKQDHILSSLLISSELKGKIHEPIFYFDKTKNKADTALDLVMLTNGWRSFIRKPLTTKEKAKFSVERSGDIKGTVVDEKGNPTEVELILFDSSNNKTICFNTDTSGKFKFKSGSSKYDHYTLLAYTKENKAVRIIDNYNYGNLEENLGEVYIDGVSLGYNANKIIRKQNIKQQYKKKTNQIVEEEIIDDAVETFDKADASFSLDEENNSLDEIVIVGYSSQRKSDITGAIETIKSQNIYENNVSVEEALQGRVSGVTIVASEGKPGAKNRIQIRGTNSITNSEPLYVIDGIPVGYSNGGSVLSSIAPSDISSVDILKDAATSAIYGCRGSNGVILISTKNSNSYSNKRVLFKRNRKNNYAIEYYSGYQKYGYSIGRQFYKPIYDSKISSDERTDFRQTIYWNPVVQTDENGEANFEFYNSDAITSFKINTEGIGYNGLLGKQETLFSAKKVLNVSFKMPNYISVNDEILMPVTITNDYNKDLKGALKINFPEVYDIEYNIQDSIVVPANSFITKNIKVVPKEKKQRSFLEIGFFTKEYTDINQVETEVLNTLFPVSTTISGNENKKYSFNLNRDNVEANSLSTNFNVKINVLSDVTDGIASLVKRPWGCFEQTASVTYPNILALKYMREQGISNNKIERKSKRYIEEGYKKLVGYQIPGGGYDWFGHGPANEVLTAYGMMLFSEMKGVYDGVNALMEKRTMNWLLSRRDNQGGFRKKNGKKETSNLLSLKAINNAYIVYAFSEAHPNIDIFKEYETAFDEALNSEDSYRLTLLGLASLNYGKTLNAKKIISILTKQIRTLGAKNLPVEYTMTHSYGSSKMIETNSLLLMLLLQNKESYMSEIKIVTDFILSNRQRDHFGNSQATSMAYKALLKYAKTNPKKNTLNDSLLITINGHQIVKQLGDRSYNRISLYDSISQYLTANKQEIKLEFSNPENTFPYNFNAYWTSKIPDTDENCKVAMSTSINKSQTYMVGSTIRFSVEVKNKQDKALAMTTAVIGIPSGASVQPWQLKEILEKKQVSYYEVFDNYLVFYWEELDPLEEKVINLDLKAEIAGNYTAPPSSVYLYYADDKKEWVKGIDLSIIP